MDSRENEFLKEIQSCQGIIYQICNVYEPDPESRKDLFQEILYQLWKSYDSFSGKSKFSTWLYRVALNTAITFYKQSGRRSGHEVRAEYIPEREVEQNVDGERIRDMYRALNELGKVDRALILLILEEKKYEEIAEIMGMTPTNVGVRLMRARKRLGVKMNEMTRET